MWWLAAWRGRERGEGAKHLSLMTSRAASFFMASLATYARMVTLSPERLSALYTARPCVSNLSDCTRRHISRGRA